MQDDEIELGLNQKALDMLLQRETEKVAEYISEQMVNILKGLEGIIQPQAEQSEAFTKNNVEMYKGKY